ncbi:MAG: hypothetical protein KDA93_20595 [Planctomycetaceae bacterium]|nr:hypothetical protein [Planctomycetaceae bacterium]
MFRCQKCERIVPAGTRTNKVVVATRPRIYEPRGQDPSERRGRSRFVRGRRVRKRKPYDKGGAGTEIVRELSVCPACAAELNAEIAAEAAAQSAPVLNADVETEVAASAAAEE